MKELIMCNKQVTGSPIVNHLVKQDNTSCSLERLDEAK